MITDALVIPLYHIIQGRGLPEWYEHDVEKNGHWKFGDASKTRAGHVKITGGATKSTSSSDIERTKQSCSEQREQARKYAASWR